MAQVNAGRVRFIGRGEYDNSTQYYTFDLVNYNGNSYFAKSNTMGNLPTNSTYWQLVAEKGNIGPAGPTGNGIDHISLTSQSGATKVYTIYYTDGTTSEYTVQDGEVTQEVFDEEVERLKMVYNAMPKVSGEGTDLTLDNTAECPVYDIELSPSEISQEADPTPDNPQDIHVVSGENSVKVENKNLFDENYYKSATYGNNVYKYTSLKFKGNRTLYFKTILKSGKTSISGLYLTVSNKSNPNLTGNKSYFLISNGTINPTASNYFDFTGEEDLYLDYYPASVTPQDIFDTYNIIVSLENADYVPHKEQTYPLSLGDLEYCKIGYYEDEFYKATESDTGLTVGKWYLKKNVRKLVLNGTESGWSYNSSYKYYMLNNATLVDGVINTPVVSNYWKQAPYLSRIGNSANLLWLFDENDYFEGNIDTFKTWLGNHNTDAYYVLKTPTYTLLSDTLQTQLDNIQKAITYQDQTNVSQTNADLPFVIKLSAIRDLSGIFEEI